MRVSACLPTTSMRRPMSEGVPVRCQFTRPRQVGRRAQSYTRSNSHSMHSLDEPPDPWPEASQIQQIYHHPQQSQQHYHHPVQCYLGDRPPWQKLIVSVPETTWGHIHSLNVKVASSVPASIAESPRSTGTRLQYHEPPRFVESGESQSKKSERTSGGTSVGSRPTQALEASGGSIRRQDIKWKRKSFKRSNGYDAADVERVMSDESSTEDIELLSAAADATSFGVHDDAAELIHPDSQGPLRVLLHDLEVSKRDHLNDSSDHGSETVGPVLGGDQRTFGSTKVGSPHSQRAVKVVSGSASRTPSRASHPPSRSAVSELAGLGFHNSNEYWEHSAFGRARICAICLASFASICLIYSFSASTWIYNGQRWQGGATCIFIVALSIGLLGTGISVVGHSGANLVKRLYYFHSGGEIFFLAGFTTFLGLGVYRSYAHSNLVYVGPLSFGAADTVGWIAGVAYFITAFCLLLDEFIHELAKLGSRWPCVNTLLHHLTHHLARLVQFRHSLALRWRKCCRRMGRLKRPISSATGAVTAAGTPGTAIGGGSTSATLQCPAPSTMVYRPTTGYVTSGRRTRRK